MHRKNTTKYKFKINNAETVFKTVSVFPDTLYYFCTKLSQKSSFWPFLQYSHLTYDSADNR